MELEYLSKYCEREFEELHGTIESVCVQHSWLVDHVANMAERIESLELALRGVLAGITLAQQPNGVKAQQLQRAINQK